MQKKKLKVKMFIPTLKEYGFEEVSQLLKQFFTTIHDRYTISWLPRNKRVGKNNFTKSKKWIFKDFGALRVFWKFQSTNIFDLFPKYQDFLNTFIQVRLDSENGFCVTNWLAQVKTVTFFNFETNCSALGHDF